MSKRTPLLQSADLPDEPRFRRWERRLFGSRPLKTDNGLTAQSALDPRVFTPTEEGSGSFGRWTIDANGLPAYQYELDQYADDRARYPNTEGLERRDHWHQVGNQRITAFTSNDGTIQVYLCDRGGVILNRFEAWASPTPVQYLKSLLFRLFRSLIQFGIRLLYPTPKRPELTIFAENQAARPPADNPRGAASPDVLDAAALNAQSAQTAPEGAEYALSGGFSFVEHDGTAWATAYRFRPNGAQTQRRFGIGYFETTTQHQDIRVTRRVYAPFGDDPVLIADVQVENLGSTPVDLRHYEYWDVNVHQLQLEWLRSGSFAPSSDEVRRAINKWFEPNITYNEAACALRFNQRVKQPAEIPGVDEPSAIDWYPAHVFLADLSGSPNAVYFDKRKFFGAGGARQPDAVMQRRAGDALPDAPPGDPMPYCLVLRRDLQLQPGEQRSLRFAYGTARPEQPLDFIEGYRQQPNLADQTQTQWKDHLVYFNTGEDAALQRETTWHAYNLLSATVYVDFFKAHIVPQGSAYLYLHGADGAPRDHALFAVPMTYVDPALARDMLRLIMQVTDAHTGQITYAFAGHGFLSDGMSIHTKPTDLDLFFLLALCEYLAATGDYDFLDQPVPFYPPQESPPDTTVLDHVRVALRHLFETTGIGDHGLIKVGSGDWSDSIVLETALSDGPGPFGVTYNNSKAHGESVYNTQMALYVLPLLAAILKDHAPQLVDYIYDTPSQPNRIACLSDALDRQWNANGWYNRAVLRNVHNQPVTIDHFSLEGQVWALISGAAQAQHHDDTLIENIDAQLDRPSPIGASLIAGGMVWPAVSQLLTWGYTRANRGQLAWRSLNRHTFAAHSHTYPDVWFNTWSGPDGINGIVANLPGGTWTSPITPMTDFPVMNANQDAMALLGLLRVCGIEPAETGDGLVIRPHVPRSQFSLVTSLLRLDVDPQRITITYHPITSGSRTFTLYHQWSSAAVHVNGEAHADVEEHNDHVIVSVKYSKGEAVQIDVTAG